MSSVPLKIKWITIDEAALNFSSLQTSLDSTKNNVVLVASPIRKFRIKSS